MPRAYGIWVVFLIPEDGIPNLIGAFTVKHELISFLEAQIHDRFEVWRVMDGYPGKPEAKLVDLRKLEVSEGVKFFCGAP